MKHISAKDMLNYAEFSGVMREVTGKRIEEPVLTEKRDDSKADFIDIWTGLLSENYKKTQSNDARRLLLLIENLDHMDELDFALLDQIIDEESEA